MFASKMFIKKSALILCLLVAIILIYATPSTQSQKIPILLYHHILSDEDNEFARSNGMVVSLENFAAQMKYLYDNEYHTITPEELYAFLYDKETLPANSVFIQFDDGYYSNIARAYPVLKEYGFKATVFSITNESRQPQQPFNQYGLTYISVESMEDVRDVFTFQSHTHDLHGTVGDKTKFKLASKDEILLDLIKSFEIVDSKIAFAYPLGQFDNTGIEALKQAGIKMAFTVKKGYVTANDDPYRLNRFIVYNTTPLKKFINYVNGTKGKVPDNPAAPVIIASPLSSKVTLDGKEILLDAYNIEDSCYINANEAIGGGMAVKRKTYRVALPCTHIFNVDGVSMNLTAYNIDGINYIKLRDAAQALGYYVAMVEDVIVIRTETD